MLKIYVQRSSKMRKIYQIAPYTIFLLLLGIGLGANAQPHYVLRGLVENTDSREPIPNALIKLLAEDLSLIDTVRTDDAGIYELDSLVNEKKYLIQASHPDYYNQKPRTIVFKNGSDQSFKLQEVVEGSNIRVEGIHFSPNDASIYEYTRSGDKILKNEVRKGIDSIRNILAENEGLFVEIACHTDSRGDEGYNLELTKRRAQAIKLELVERGIPAHRIIAKGYGESQLINKCENDVKCSGDEHAQNRRVELVVLYNMF
ncbi:MAG: hypothetical protein EAZ57_07440 [Cytophagales bacterium]|nr:MAG: hypothetical protein EAZ67_08525 [Cytophagales bacterium]TAF60371.1 MAG: hypothetical protein EAZ57_07440 [Cytophagales bacterium]